MNALYTHTKHLNKRLQSEDKIFPCIRNTRWFLANQTASPTWDPPCQPNRPIYLCEITSYVYPVRKSSLWNLISADINCHYSQTLSGRTNLLKNCQNLRLIGDDRSAIHSSNTLGCISHYRYHFSTIIFRWSENGLWETSGGHKVVLH